MTLLDRFRTQPKDKHPDPVVRLAFLDELPLTERELIAAVAREDEDTRVRKAAVAKLLVPSALAAIAKDDLDEEVRSQATTMLRDLALEAFEDAGEAEALGAVDAMVEPRLLAQIAKTSTRATVALRALDRVDDAHVLGSVARHAVVEDVRQAAFDRIVRQEGHSELLSIALNSEFKDTAVAAIERLTDRVDLEQVIARGKNKSAVKRARGIVREADEQAALDAAEAAAIEAAAAIEQETAVLEPAEEVASPPHGDPLADEAREIGIGEVVDTHADITDSDQQANDDDRLAREAAFRDAERQQRDARLSALMDEAVAAAADPDPAAGRKRFAALRRDWQQTSAGIEMQPGLAERFAILDAEMTAREREAQEADARERRDALARVSQLVTRVEALVGKDDVSVKAGERGLRDIRTALSAMPHLPTKQDFEDVTRRLKAAQASLGPKVQELREADDWKRFANVAIQDQLCTQMEALKTAEDLDAAARQVHELQLQWKAAADVPRAQADTLWRRFKTAHDEVWGRVESHFAVQAEQRNGNLARKIALCEQAEALSESTNWIETAEALKNLQAEWKAIGPVSRGKEKSVWDRFRVACDRFFTRRHADLASRKAVWSENLAKKDALSARAEALTASTDWENAAAEIRRLQAEWKTIGPVKKSKSEAVWHRFRSACDQFFSRYAQRHDTARAERVAAREAVCVELELLAASPEAPADLVALVRTLRGRWQQEVVQRGVDPERARELDQRFAAGFNALVSKWPQVFGGTDLDPSANRKRMENLVRRVEDLAKSLEGSKAADESLSPTVRLAAMLKDALAANTIGGKVDDDSRFRAALDEARQAQAAWSRIGPVPDEIRRPLTDRFQRALAHINDRQPRSSHLKRESAAVRS